MTELERDLKNVSIQFLNNWIEKETNNYKKSILKKLRSVKLLSSYNYNEKIMVIERSKLKDFNGFIRNTSSISNILKTCSKYLSRADVEYDRDYIQIVSSGILLREEKGKRFYGLFERTHLNKSINKINMIGGHVNIKDSSLEIGFIREMFEEIKNISPNNISNIKHLGFIKEDETDKTRGIHMCSLYLVKVIGNDNSLSNIKSITRNEKFIWVEETQIKKMLNTNDPYIESWCREGLKYLINEEGAL